MLHKVAIVVGAAAVKGVVVAGHMIGHALAANPTTAGEVALGKAVAVPLAHAAAAHPVAAALAGTAVVGTPIVTIAYLDVAAAKKQLAAGAQGVTSQRTVKVSVAGNLINGEFSTITGPLRSGKDLVLLGNYDEDKQTMTKTVLLKPNRVESRIAAALAGGNVVVLA